MIDPATGQQLVAAPMMAHAHGQVFQVTRDSIIKLFICLSVSQKKGSQEKASTNCSLHKDGTLMSFPIPLPRNPDKLVNFI